MKESIRIGTGAGYSGDRIEPAVDLAKKGNLDYLIFECLAERTIALAQMRKTKDPNSGYDPLLEERMRACLAICKEKGIKIISNMGAANPIAAAEKTAEIAKSLNLKDLKIAALIGDDVLDQVKNKDYQLLESGAALDSIRTQIISANAYLGVEGIVEALRNGADIIFTGRVADPALFLAPMIIEFDWSLKDYDLLGKGTTLGHLMECAGQVTGGYFADLKGKQISDLANLGFPIAEVKMDGSFYITKLPEAGGTVTVATCTEQLLYEIHDPEQYFTPNVVADFSRVTMQELEQDKIAIFNGSGKPPSGWLKVSVGYRDGFIGEGQISYGGSDALERAKLALEIVKTRLQHTSVEYSEARFDIIGNNHLYGTTIAQGTPNDVRIRVAARTSDRKQAVKIGNEVETLYTNGPSGGGGVTKSVQEIVAIQSVLLEADLVKQAVHYINI